MSKTQQTKQQHTTKTTKTTISEVLQENPMLTGQPTQTVCSPPVLRKTGNKNKTDKTPVFPASALAATGTGDAAMASNLGRKERTLAVLEPLLLYKLYTLCSV